jgi:HD superfamily phosphohydrolase
MSEKIIRDPVHDVIAFRTSRPDEMLLFRLLGAAEFQRLRRIRQLGMAHLAYPGADHSRYGHSLGAMETARRILDCLRREHPIDEAGEVACLVAVLLHDIGHGPFSHVFERVSGIHHEQITLQIIEDTDGEVHQLLADYDPKLPRAVVALLTDTGPRTFFHDILSSQLDADRLDYLLRDNLMTGSRYGEYDLNWLLHALIIDPASGRLAISWKGVSAIEAYLQSRYHMYRNVYFHKVVRSAEGMVKLALQRAKRLAVQDRLSWPPREHVVFKALVGQRLSTGEFTDLDDVSLMHCFKVWSTCDDTALACLCRGLLYRKLFKTIDLTILEDGAANAAVAAARAAIEVAGGDARYDLIYDQPADTPYETGLSSDPGELLVRDATGRLIPFATLSPLPAALNQQLMFRRIHVAENWKQIALQATAPFTGRVA